MNKQKVGLHLDLIKGTILSDSDQIFSFHCGETPALDLLGNIKYIFVTG